VPSDVIALLRSLRGVAFLVFRFVEEAFSSDAQAAQGCLPIPAKLAPLWAALAAASADRSPFRARHPSPKDSVRATARW